MVLKIIALLTLSMFCQILQVNTQGALAYITMSESHRLFWEAAIGLDLAFISDPVIHKIRSQIGPYDFGPLFYELDAFFAIQKDIMNGSLQYKDWT